MILEGEDDYNKMPPHSPRQSHSRGSEGRSVLSNNKSLLSNNRSQLSNNKSQLSAR